MSQLRIGEKRKQLNGPTYELDGAIPALVTWEEFERVSRLREARRTMNPRQLGSVYLLSGLGRCGKCGQPVNGKQGSDKWYHSCLGRLITTCDCALMGAPMLEEIVLEQVKQRLSGESMREHVRSIEEQIRVDIAVKEYGCVALEQKLPSLEKPHQAGGRLLRGDLDGKTYGRLPERVEAEKVWIGDQVSGARQTLWEARGATVDVGQLRAMADSLDVRDALPPESLKPTPSRYR